MATSMGEETVMAEMKSIEVICTSGRGFVQEYFNRCVLNPAIRVAVLPPRQTSWALVRGGSVSRRDHQSNWSLSVDRD